MLKEISLKELEDLLEDFYQERVPLYLWGKPSTGKTSMIRQFAQRKAEELGLKYSEDEFGEDIFTLKVIPLSQFEGPDLRGIPHIKNDRYTEFIPSAELPREGQGIIFFDELNMADDMTRAACYQYILEGRYSNLKPVLDENGKHKFWRVAASNTEKDFCSVNNTSLALLRRFCHFEVMPNLEEILEYFLEHDLDNRVIAYLEKNPDDLFPVNFDEKLLENKANPFPYTWEVAARLIKKYDMKVKKDKEKIRNLVASGVGSELATKFVAFCELIKKIDIESLVKALKNKQTLNKKLKEFAELGDAVSHYIYLSNYVANLWFKADKRVTAADIVNLLNTYVDLGFPELAVQLARKVIRKRSKRFETLKDWEKLCQQLSIYL